MIVYELPIGFQFPEGTNTPMNILYLAIMLGINSNVSIWSIQPITQEDESIPNMETFGNPINLIGDVTKLGYRRLFMPGISISQIEETIEQLKLSIDSNQ